MGITIQEIDLDAEWAGRLLERNSTNRPFKRQAIQTYSADMLAGRWKFTAEPIKVDNAGNLQDGQNRCRALQVAQEQTKERLTIRVLLVTGLDPDAQDMMDTGVKRSLGDQLARRKIPNSSLAAAAVRLIVRFAIDKPAGVPKTQAQEIEFFEEHGDEVRECMGVSTHNTSGLHGSAMVAARYLIGQACEESDWIDVFFAEVATGIGLQEGSPALALRTRMFQARANHETLRNYQQLTMLLRVWNSWRLGEKMTKVPIRSRNRLILPERIEG